MHEVRQATEEGTLPHILDQTAGDWPLDIATEFARIGLRCSEEENRDEQGVAGLIGETTKEITSESRGHSGACPLDVPDIFLCPNFQVCYVQDDMSR